MQLNYENTFPMGRAGMLADARDRTIISRLALTPIAAGLAVLRQNAPTTGDPQGAHPGGVSVLTPFPAVGADADAIVATALPSAEEPQEFGAGELDGIAGNQRLIPARQISLSFNDSAASWNTGTAVTVHGVDKNGTPISEDFDVENDGTVNGDLFFARVDRIIMPAQDGDAGELTAGIQAGADTINAMDIAGVALWDPSIPALRSGPVPFPAEGEYELGDTVPVIARGSVYVITEDACTPQDGVFVRIAGGGEGNFRSDADTSNAVQLLNARWDMVSEPGGINKLILTE